MSQHKEAYVISYHGTLCHDYHGIPSTHSKNYIPTVLGLKEAMTRSSSHPFQYNLEMARLGAVYPVGREMLSGA